ncbi:MAG: response regulator, partial [Anaerolineales bacterium]
MRESRTVLLAFSDEKLLDGLESTLKGNYRIEKAMTCQEVRQSLPEIQPEVVLLEERLDNGKGVKLALELFSENPALQLILFSQETSKLNTRQALALGLADWLRLPAKPNTVREAVKQCFARRDRWRKWHQQEEKKVSGR